MYELPFVARSGPSPMRWRGWLKMRELKRQNGVRRRTLLYKSTQTATTGAAAGEPVRRHAKSPAKAIPDIAFIAPAEAQLDSECPGRRVRTDTLKKCRIILVPPAMVVKKIYVGA